MSPSYYLASKKTSSNKHANVFTYFTQKRKDWGDGKCLTLGKKGDNLLLHSSSPPSQISITGLWTKRVRKTAGEKNQGIINLGLKRKMLLGILRTERGPLGPLFSPPFWNGWIWGWVCLLLGRRVWLWRTKRGQGGAQGKRARDRLL